MSKNLRFKKINLGDHSIIKPQNNYTEIAFELLLENVVSSPIITKIRLNIIGDKFTINFIEQERVDVNATQRLYAGVDFSKTPIVTDYYLQQFSGLDLFSDLVCKKDPIPSQQPFFETRYINLSYDYIMYLYNFSIVNDNFILTYVLKLGTNGSKYIKCCYENKNDKYNICVELDNNKTTIIENGNKTIYSAIDINVPHEPNGDFTNISTFQNTSANDVSTTVRAPPDSNMAVGPNNLVVAVNDYIVLLNKDRTEITRKYFNGTSGFWGTTSNITFPSTNDTENDKGSDLIFDPWIVYDHYENRFILVTCRTYRPGFVNENYSNKLNWKGFLDIAISKTNSPNDLEPSSWYFYQIDRTHPPNTENVNIGAFPDFCKLAYDKNAYYITEADSSMSRDSPTPENFVYEFSFFAIMKNSILNGGTLVTKLDNIKYDKLLFPAINFNINSNDMYLFRQIDTITNGTDELSIIKISNIIGTPIVAEKTVKISATFSNLDINITQGNGFKGLLDSNDDRTVGAVLRNNSLWTCNSMILQNGKGPVLVAWYEIDISDFDNTGPKLIQEGVIQPDDITDNVWMPNISADKDNNMAIGFTIGGPNRIASMAYTGRLALDPLGSTRKITIAKQGDHDYQSFNRPISRWGDYFGLALDPTDQCTFWAFSHVQRGEEDFFGDLCKGVICNFKAINLPPLYPHLNVISPIEFVGRIQKTVKLPGISTMQFNFTNNISFTFSIVNKVFYKTEFSLGLGQTVITLFNFNSGTSTTYYDYKGPIRYFEVLEDNSKIHDPDKLNIINIKYSNGISIKFEFDTTYAYLYVQGTGPKQQVISPSRFYFYFTNENPNSIYKNPFFDGGSSIGHG